MPPRIRVEHVQFFDEHPIKWGGSEENAYPGCDGAVWYEIEYDVPGAQAHMLDGSIRPDKAYSYMMQPFRRGSNGKRPGFENEGNADRGNVWGWDGNREAPTLTPSFLCEDPGRGGEHPLPPVRVHLHLTKGHIELGGDSSVVVA